MRSYVVVAGLIFGLLALAHLWRIIVEPDVARDPWFIVITVAAAALSVAAWRLVARSRPS